MCGSLWVGVGLCVWGGGNPLSLTLRTLAPLIKGRKWHVDRTRLVTDAQRTWCSSFQSLQARPAAAWLLAASHKGGEVPLTHYPTICCMQPLPPPPPTFESPCVTPDAHSLLSGPAVTSPATRSLCSRFVHLLYRHVPSSGAWTVLNNYTALVQTTVGP